MAIVTILEQAGRCQRVTVLGQRGRPGPPGSAGSVESFPVGPVMLNGHTAVAVNASGQLVAADATNPAHLGAIPGIVVNAYGPGASAPVRNDTIVHHAGWSWANGPVLVGTNGALVQTLPGGAVFSQVIGFAVAPTIVRVDVQIPISLI